MERTPGVGDTPHLSSEPALVDTSQEPVLPPPQGDSHERGVRLVEQTLPKQPTAGELRAMGYVVEDNVADHEVPYRWRADTPARPGEVHLVDAPFVQVQQPPPVQEAVQGAETAQEPSQPVEGVAQPVATPAAEAHAQELAVDLADIEGTGKEGRVTKADVDAAVEESEDTRKRRKG